MDRAVTNTETSICEPKVTWISLRQIPQYAACLGFGLLGGFVGVALAIGLVILVQLLLPPSVVFSPGIIPLMVTAVLAGLIASCLLGRAAYPILRGPLGDPYRKGLQLILVCSTFASLFQALLFFA